MSRTPFRGAVPDGLLYNTVNDMCVITEGAEVVLGRGLGTVERAETVLAVHALISLVLLEANEAAEEAPTILDRDPYVAGWMVRGRATAREEERRGLVDAASDRDHMRRIEPEAVIQ